MTELASARALADERAVPDAPVLTLSLLGGASLSVRGQDVRINNRKARAILGYLGLSTTGEEQRERLAGLFWSEAEEDKARATLRQAVHEIREALDHAGCAALRASRLTLGLVPRLVRIDVLDLLQSLQDGEAPDPLLRQSRLAETLLAGFEDLDPAFHVWLLARRQSLHDRMMQALEDHYRKAELPRNLRRRFASAAQRLDPTHEEACRVFMHCAAQDGDPVAALRAYNELWTLLDQDYDSEPSHLTQELVADIKLGKYEPVTTESGLGEEALQLLVPERPKPAPQPARELPPRMAVQVAAFGINGVESDRMHLVTGFRHELIACLVRFREWLVIDADVPIVRSANGAGTLRYLVEANAYQAGSAIHVVLTLRDCEASTFVWSERFELRLESWFEAQQRIVRRIAGTLSGQISAERLQRIAAEPDVGLDVYDAWLRGQGMTETFSAEEWNKAARLFIDITQRSPNFSPLYSSLVQMNNSMHIVHPGMWRETEKAAATLRLARRAVALDALDSRAQLCLGWALAMTKHYTQAAVHMQLACELNPNDSWTLISAALFHAFNGEPDVARNLVRQSFDATLLPSRVQWGYEACIAYLAGDDATAVEATGRAEDVIINLPAWRAAALFNLGEKREAEREAQRFLAGVRANWTADEPPTDETIGRWLMHLYPISHAEQWERLRRGVVGAGIPVVGIKHHQW
jgi:DNA-binding SARP family transcriptional activator/TolB-like protein